MSITKADLRDITRAIAALDRIAARHGTAWHDDYAFDPLASCRERLAEVQEVESDS